MSRRLVSTSLVIGMIVAGTTAPASAAEGPGLGPTECAANELWKPIGFFDNGNGTPTNSPSKAYGHNVVIMVHGYLMVLYAPDSGLATGGLLFYDVSNPRRPRLVHSVRNADTAAFRETHSLPVAHVGDKDYVVLQTVSGVQFWDLTDPLRAAAVGKLDLPGVAGGDYDNVAWQTSWQWPYVFVAGANRGIFVVDATDPTKPRLVTQVPTSRTGGYRVGPIFAMGDYLVVGNYEDGARYSLLDIADAKAPALITSVQGFPRIYSMSVFGDRIYGAGRNGDFLIHRFTPRSIDTVHIAKVGGDGLYVAYQDGYAHLGLTDDYRKIDVRNESAPKVVGTGLLGRDHADHGQATVFGNLVFIGNDHGSGSGFICHASALDKTPPTVLRTFPSTGATRVHVGSRITVSFSDNIDVRSVDPTSIVVREAGGPTVEGSYSYIFNSVSFGPAAPFRPNTTYQLVVAAGGVKDIMGNAIAESTEVTFSTGATIGTSNDAGTDTAPVGSRDAGAADARSDATPREDAGKVDVTTPGDGGRSDGSRADAVTVGPRTDARGADGKPDSGIRSDTEGEDDPDVDPGDSPGGTESSGGCSLVHVPPTGIDLTIAWLMAGLAGYARRRRRLDASSGPRGVR